MLKEFNVFDKLTNNEFKNIMLTLIDEVENNIYIPETCKSIYFFTELVLKTYKEHKEELYNLGSYTNIPKELIDAVYMSDKNVLVN